MGLMGLMSCFGDIEGKLRKFVLLAADGDLAAMSLHHLIDVVQSESEARDAALAVFLMDGGPSKLVEDNLLLLLRDTDAIVAYL